MVTHIPVNRTSLRFTDRTFTVMGFGDAVDVVEVEVVDVVVEVEVEL
jgi:hypothetical protein